MKIHILGASGSGTTTLGQALGRHGWKHLDADDYYWEPTDPPFQQKVSPSIRNERITEDFNAASQVIISGSMFSWGEHWKRAFDLVVFIQINSEIRMERLKVGEVERYGAALDENLTKACMTAYETRDPAACRTWAENFSWEAATRQFITNLATPEFDNQFWLRSAKMID